MKIFPQKFLNNPSKTESFVLYALHSDLSGYTDTLVSLYQQINDEELWNFCKTNQIESIIAHVLTDIFGMPDVPVHWLQAHENNYKRISSYLNELDTVATKLKQAGIPLIALKNGGIARGIYPCPGCCPMGDLDVLVEKGHFCKAHEILIQNGYYFEFRSPLEKVKLDAAEKSGGAEYWKILSNGEKFWFELQWRPIAGRWIRPDQEPSAEELMQRSIPIHGTDVRLLSSEDNLLQVTLHTAKHSYVRAPGFRLHLDVDRIVHYQKIDWDLFLKKVIALKVKTAVYFSLLIPKMLFQTPIPDHVLSSLKPQEWKEKLIIRWLKKAGIFNPDEKKFSKMGYIVFTALLYDNTKGLCKAIVPDSKIMQEKYEIKNHQNLFLFYFKRLMDLTFRRINT